MKRLQVSVRKAPPRFYLPQFFERLEHLQSLAPEILVVSRHNRKIVLAGSRGPIAVLRGHRMIGLLKETLLAGPNLSCGHVVAEDSALQRFAAGRERRWMDTTYPRQVYCLRIQDTLCSAAPLQPCQPHEAGSIDVVCTLLCELAEEGRPALL